MAKRTAAAVMVLVCLSGAARAELTRGRKIAIGVIVSASVAMTATGAALIATGLDEYNHAGTAPTIADFRRMTRQGDDIETAGIALVVVSGLFGTVGGLMMTLTGIQPPRRRAQLWIAPTGNGAMVGGAF